MPLILYLIVINLISAIICITDKRRAIKGLWRISEKTFFLLALFGGGVGLYITMRAIHHKTNHKRFMIGIPIIIILQIVVIVYITVDNVLLWW